ncbi:MAG: glycine--tRNA ligase, partial [Euryarchaeota archaeon HGW-Euryarchaeota-1]
MVSIQTSLTIEKLATFCYDNAFVYPSGEIYNGFAGFWDYGPRGVEVKNAIKRSWWKRFVQTREDVVGIDGAIITNPRVWEASGHVVRFKDPIVSCKKCGKKYRADHLVEDGLKISTDGMSVEELDKKIKENKIKCLECKEGDLSDVTFASQMISASAGGSNCYLRPETAQSIFPNFKLIQKQMRIKLPFGIAQIGKAFRNEISPRDFLFRSREFEQMELEFFVHPKKLNEAMQGSWENNEIVLNSRENQTNKTEPANVKFKELKANSWHQYWLWQITDWLINGLGIKKENIRLREHLKEELSHYSVATFDVEYNFPFGWKEIVGMADRGNYDLTQHSTASGQDLDYFDDETNEKVRPVVAAEPSVGVDRVFLALLCEAYTEEEVKGEQRVLLKLKPEFSPVFVGILPLVKKGGLSEKAQDVFNLLNNEFVCFYDEKGSIGRRYRRLDEIGAPFAITVDFQTLEDETVTVRERDSMKQERVK